MNKKEYAETMTFCKGVHNNKDIPNIKLGLYATDYFQLMEKIYYKYISPIGKKFSEPLILNTANMYEHATKYEFIKNTNMGVLI